MRFLFPAIVICSAAVVPALAADRVTTANGILESTSAPKDGVRNFKGIPFAQPPVGDLRWREPQPVTNWTGARNADQFGPRCMQRTSPGADYWFRSNGMSEDCLYLNVVRRPRAGCGHRCYFKHAPGPRCPTNSRPVVHAERRNSR